MNHVAHGLSWTQILLHEVEAFRRETGQSREAFAQRVVEDWQEAGQPQMGRDWKAGGDVFEAARVNAQRLYRWLDDQTKDHNLLPANMVPAVLMALPEPRRVRALNAQLRELGFMVERIPSGGGAAVVVNSLVSDSIRESGEAQQALLRVATDGSLQALEDARRESVEAAAAHGDAVAYLDREIHARRSRAG